MGAKAAQALSGAKEIGELAMGLAERNIPSSFEFAQTLAGKRSQGRGGAAYGLRKLPDRGSCGTGQGTWRTGGQDDRQVPSVDLRIVLTHGVRNPQNTGAGMSFCASQYFYCNASKCGV
jgi:hypothetical protein